MAAVTISRFALFAVTLSIISLFCLDIVTGSASGPVGPILELPDGTIRGKQESVPGGQAVEMFLGIPYADPPIGELRFAAPRPLSKPWNEVRDCTKYAAICTQGPCRPTRMTSAANVGNGSQSEDCLTINIYRPANVTSNHRLPVMAWLHGGGFYKGNGNMYDGSAVASHNDVIVVTVNYRLGLLGFLNMPGTELKGNYGMLDQVQALKWVQRNIATFGGNPMRVTIFGESAGGASVALHILSPLSKGLFRNAILQSGTANAPFGSFTIKKEDTRYDVFFEMLHCLNKKDLLSCLREKTADEYLEAQGICDMNTLGAVFPVPRVDGEFLPDEPRVLLSEGRFNKPESVMMGVTDDEGPFFAHPVRDSPTLEGLQKAAREVALTQNGEDDSLREAILEQYINDADQSPEGIVTSWSTLFGDAWFVAPSVITAKRFVQAGIPVHFYQLSHRAKFSVYPAWVGCTHFDDIQYVFGVPWKWNPPLAATVTSYTEDDKRMSSFIMKLWATFAKNGTPEIADLVTWPQYSTESEEYLDISLDPKVKSKLYADHIAFWENIVPKLKYRGSLADKKRNEL